MILIIYMNGRKKNIAPDSTLTVVGVRFHNHYEELLNDLQINIQRKPFFLDYWRPYYPDDYETVKYEVFENKKYGLYK